MSDNKTNKCSFSVGTCEALCPKNEVDLREKNNMVHFYERDGLLLKSFSRSAAASDYTNPKNLRTFQALRKSEFHLFNKILVDSQRTYSFRFDFIFDRTRAIRQEIVIQNFSHEKTIELLEPIVIFLAFSLYKLSSASITQFDPKICTQHLQECILKSLCCYEQLDEVPGKPSYNKNNRILLEGIYLLLNMSNTRALQRGIKLSPDLKSSYIIKTCLQMSLNYSTGNYFKVLHNMCNLPHILAAIASLKLPEIRTKVLHIFSIAYSSTTLKVPLDFLQKLLIYDDQSQLIADLIHLDILNDNTSPAVLFNRKKFDTNKSIKSTSLQEFVELKIRDCHLPDLILLDVI
ncbi:unnamed protein product [Diamesa tonsa]